jgi:hypothetical protein
VRRVRSSYVQNFKERGTFFVASGMALMMQKSALQTRASPLLMPQRPQRGRLVIQNASKVTGKIKLALTAGKVRSCKTGSVCCNVAYPSAIMTHTNTHAHSQHRPIHPHLSVLPWVARCEGVCVCVWGEGRPRVVGVVLPSVMLRVYRIYGMTPSNLPTCRVSTSWRSARSTMLPHKRWPAKSSQ